MKYHKSSLLPFRPCVAIMLINTQGHVFLGKRIDTQQDAWQMPQGGIDPGESFQDAAKRELYEETGVKSVTILAESQEWYPYEIPDFLQTKLWGGAYRGQTQKWYLMAFKGDESEFNLCIMPKGQGPFATHQEFMSWKWVPLNEVIPLTVFFKKDIYEKVIAEFSPHISAYVSSLTP